MNNISSDALKDRYRTAEVLQALRGIQYGSIEIVIHASQVVQIIRKERLRFDEITASVDQ